MLPDRLQRLVHLLARLPGVGEKTALRYAMHLATEDGQLATQLGADLRDLATGIGKCTCCGNMAEIHQDRVLCDVCLDTRRDATVMCIVAKVQDLLAIENSGAMRGRYFVLGRLLSPLDGIGPQQLPLEALLGRIGADGVQELIIATPPSVDGEATALLIAREVESTGVRVSRIASGVPHGGDLEYADQITLGRAIDGRRSIDVGDS